MTDFKPGDVVFHKATAKQGVVNAVRPPHVFVDFGDGSLNGWPISSFSLVESPDIMSRLAALEGRVAVLEREMRPDKFGFAK